MLLGMPLFTAVHVLLSLVALATGVIVLFQLRQRVFKSQLAVAYLVTSVLTTATGFGFAFVKLLPSHIVGGLSSVSLLLMAWAAFRLAGSRARVVYIVAASISVYFLAFVALAQAFTKIPALNALGPGLSGAPFIVAQTAVLAAFVVWTVLILTRQRGKAFHPVA
jgi:hypothetical protein